MDLRSIDLNLLVVFHQLLLERQVSKVAQTLGMSQPGVSNALRRLRLLLGDPLFVRTVRGMEPTPYATQLAESVSYALGMLHAAVNQRMSFDPKTSERSFRIAMSDIGEIYFLPALMDLLLEEAPGLKLSTVRDSAINLRDEMESGSVDLAIGFIPELRTGFFQRKLFRQRYVCMFRQGHKLDKRRISLADFSAAEHVAVLAQGTGHGQIDGMLERAGVQRRVRLTVPHFVAVGHIVSSTDMVATVPEKFAERTAAPFGLRYLPHPAKLPEIAIHMFWHAKYNKEPASRWMRDLMFAAFAE